MAETRFQTTVVREGPMCFLPVPFDPKAVFGKVRAPVIVTVNGHSYRSTIASMGNGPCLPLRKSNREAAGLEGHERVTVSLAPDVAPRTVKAPTDLLRALEARGVTAQWKALSFSHQREHVAAIEDAKKPETRLKRITACVAGLKLNRRWHLAHVMPPKATDAQRLKWHLAHAKACGCRPIPKGLLGG